MSHESMLHRNDITYSPRSAAQCQCEYPSAPLAEGKVYSYQLSPAPLFAVFLLRPCFYALQLCLFRLFWYIQIHGDGRQVALHVSNGARLISGKLCGRVQGCGSQGSEVRGSRGGARTNNLQQLCAKVFPFSSLANVTIWVFFFFFWLLAHFLALLQCHSGQDTLRTRPRRRPRHSPCK